MTDNTHSESSTPLPAIMPQRQREKYDRNDCRDTQRLQRTEGGFTWHIIALGCFFFLNFFLLDWGNFYLFLFFQHLLMWTYTSVHSQAKMPLGTQMFFCTVKKKVWFVFNRPDHQHQVGNQSGAYFPDCSPPFRLFLELCCVCVLKKQLIAGSVFLGVHIVLWRILLLICWTWSRLYEQ